MEMNSGEILDLANQINVAIGYKINADERLKILLNFVFS